MKLTAALLGIALLLTGCSSGASKAEQNCAHVFIARVGTVPKDQDATVTAAAVKYCQAAEKKDPDAFQGLYG